MNAKLALLLSSAVWSAFAAAAGAAAAEQQGLVQASATIKHYAVAFAFLGAATSLSFDESPTVKKAWSAFLSGVGLSIVLTPIIVRYVVGEWPKLFLPLQFEVEVAVAYAWGAGGFHLFPWAISIARNPLSIVDWWRGKGSPPPPPGSKP